MQITHFLVKITTCNLNNGFMSHRTEVNTFLLRARQEQSACGVCVCFPSLLLFFLSPSTDFSPGANYMMGFHLCSPLMLLIGSLGLRAGLSPFGDLNKNRSSLSFSLLLACPSCCCFCLSKLVRILEKKKKGYVVGG